MEPISGKFEVEKFDGKGDFGLWKYRVLGQFEILGLLDVLEEQHVEEEITEESTDEKKEIKKDTVAKDVLWSTLQENSLFETGKSVSNQSLKRVQRLIRD